LDLVTMWPWSSSTPPAPAPRSVPIFTSEVSTASATRPDCSWTSAAAPVASTGARAALGAPSLPPPPPPPHPATSGSAAAAAQLLALAYRFTYHLRRDFFPMTAEQAWDRSRLRHAPGRILECGVRAAAYRIAACCDHRPSGQGGGDGGEERDGRGRGPCAATR